MSRLVLSLFTFFLHSFSSLPNHLPVSQIRSGKTPIFFLFLGFLFLISACSPGPEQLLPGKWAYDYLQPGNDKVVADESKKSWLTFKEDGTYQLVFKGMNETGKWSIDAGELEIFPNNSQDVQRLKIIKLDKKELVFTSAISEHSMLFYFSRSN